MKFTQYFLHTRERDDRKDIKLEWITYVFYNYEFEVIQEDGRFKRWAYIKEIDKYLRIIVLEYELTIHNAFLDRTFKIKNL